MITVDEKQDGTQVWANVEGDYTFVPLDTLRPGDRLEADHRRPAPQVLSQNDLNQLALLGPNPAEIFVRVRSATPADRVKPSRPPRPGGSGGGQGNPRTPDVGGNR